MRSDIVSIISICVNQARDDMDIINILPSGLNRSDGAGRLGFKKSSRINLARREKYGREGNHQKKKLNKIKHGNHTTEEDQEDPSICAVVGDLRRNEGLRYGL